MCRDLLAFVRHCGILRILFLFIVFNMTAIQVVRWIA
jgi:hypothetical protein